MYLFAWAYSCAYRCLHTCIYMWKPEVNLSCSPDATYPSYFEAGSLTDLELTEQDRLVASESPRNQPVSISPELRLNDSQHAHLSFHMGSGIKLMPEQLTEPPQPELDRAQVLVSSTHGADEHWIHRLATRFQF